jgi:hypothetical protein
VKLKRLINLGALLLTLTLSGCNVGGFLLSALMPYETTPAKYTPLKEPMLVMVENYDAPSAGYLESEQVAKLVSDSLVEHEVAPLVPQDRLKELRLHDPVKYRDMSIAAVGKAVQARQVLYVRIMPQTEETVGGSDMLKARLGAQVKVVDVDSGETRWPVNAEGYPISVESQFQSRGQVAPDASLRQQMCQKLSEHIASAFYNKQTPP